MKKTVLATFYFLLLTCHCLAQNYVPVTDEVITVNSQTSLTGSTRNITRVTLPEKTIGYIYRISVSPKGGTNVSNTLFNVLRNYEPTLALTSSLMELAIKSNDGSSVDAFIFNNTYDADNFYSKKDDNWSTCKTMNNRSNCCFATKDCINRELFFGFRNNNIRQGLDVKLEVVAIVDSSKASNYSYSYTLHNGTNQEIKYQLSLDNKSWQQDQLRDGYQKTYTLEQPEAYIRINTSLLQFVQYKITPGERYKIIYNQGLGKWDLMRY